ncbi:MAG: hypothetical protein ACLQUY_11145 [Ktedonobacterales bacterium]
MSRRTRETPWSLPCVLGHLPQETGAAPHRKAGCHDTRTSERHILPPPGHRHGTPDDNATYLLLPVVIVLGLSIAALTFWLKSVLPRRLDHITAALERGQFTANVRLFADERDAQLLSRLVSRAVLAFIGVGLALASALLLGQSGSPHLAPTLTVDQLFGYGGLVCSAVLVLRVIVTIARERVG